MWPTMAYLCTGGVPADAVFVSGLQPRDDLSATKVRQAVAAAIGAFGCLGCAGRVAQEFGDHPETAVIRMRWARTVARRAYPGSASDPGVCADTDALLEMEKHLRGLLYMWRLALPSSEATASEAVT